MLPTRMTSSIATSSGWSGALPGRRSTALESSTSPSCTDPLAQGSVVIMRKNQDAIIAVYWPDDWKEVRLGYYPPPPWSAFLFLDQQLTPIPSRCRVESICGRDANRATGRKVVLVVFSGTLL